jgi:hypothetical protein
VKEIKEETKRQMKLVREMEEDKERIQRRKRKMK